MLFRVPLNLNEMRTCLEGARARDDVTLHNGDSQSLREIIDDNMSVKAIFPEGSLINNNTVFEAIEVNVPHLVEMNPNIFVCYQNGTPSSLSLGTFHNCGDETALRCNFNYYGRCDVTEIISHARRHISLCHSGMGRRTKLFLVVLMPNEFRERFGEDSLKSRLSEAFGVSSNSVRVFHQVALQYKRPPFPLPNCKEGTGKL